MFLLPTVMNSRASTTNINLVSNTTNQQKDIIMRFSFFMKEIAIQQKEQAEHLKVKRTQDRINDALKNTRKDKQALKRRKSELRESRELVKALKKSQRSDAGIDKSLRPKISLQYAYVPNDRQTIADPQVLDKNKPTRTRKMTSAEFFAQEVPKSENSLDKQIVDIKDILNNS
tara:strand:- start:946 stop:1464 length:519 start_codon:yes stop_codon:yes gene_type:complete